jgi:cell division protein ZapE
VRARASSWDAAGDGADIGSQPLGASDYIAISRAYHAVLVGGVPRMGPGNRNEARRFMTLVDELYEHKTKLVLTAAAPLESLFEWAAAAKVRVTPAHTARR